MTGVFLLFPKWEARHPFTLRGVQVCKYSSPFPSVLDFSLKMPQVKTCFPLYPVHHPQSSCFRGGLAKMVMGVKETFSPFSLLSFKTSVYNFWNHSPPLNGWFTHLTSPLAISWVFTGCTTGLHGYHSKSEDQSSPQITLPSNLHFNGWPLTCTTTKKKGWNLIAWRPNRDFKKASLLSEHEQYNKNSSHLPLGPWRLLYLLGNCPVDSHHTRLLFQSLQASPSLLWHLKEHFRLFTDLKKILSIGVFLWHPANKNRAW